MMVLQKVECKDYRLLEASTQISKERLGGQAVYAGSAFLWAVLERVPHGSGAGWGSQEVRDARNMEHLPKKSASSKYSQLKREDKWLATVKTVGVGLPKPTNLTSCCPMTWMLDMELQDWTFDLLGLGLAFVPSSFLFPYSSGGEPMAHMLEQAHRPLAIGMLAKLPSDWGPDNNCFSKLRPQYSGLIAINEWILSCILGTHPWKVHHHCPIPFGIWTFNLCHGILSLILWCWHLRVSLVSQRRLLICTFEKCCNC